MTNGKFVVEGNGRRRLTPQQQSAAMVFATTVSVIYIQWTSSYWELPTLPTGLWATYWASTVTVVIIISAPQLIKSVGQFFVDLYSGGEPESYNGDGPLPESDSRIYNLTKPAKMVFALVTVLYAFTMIIVLSWATLPTGGSIHSPYSQLLFAAALLAPYIAKRNTTGLAMGVVAITGFYVCHFVIKPDATPAVPDMLIFLTTAAATLTSVGVTAVMPLLKRLGGLLSRIRLSED